MTFDNDRDPIATDESIGKFELFLGRKLPEDYRQFLLDHNGGSPVKEYLFVPDLKEGTLVSFFYGIGRKNSDLKKEYLGVQGDMYGKFLPVGHDAGGNRLLLELANGHIWYWDAVRFFKSSSSKRNAYHVSDSFSGLLEKLQEFRGDE